MRRIGTLPTEREARTFHDYLYLQNIESDVDPDDDGTFAIWVHDDAHVDSATRLMERFRANPNGDEFSKVSGDASRTRSRQEKEDARRRSSVINRERMGYERNFLGSGMLSIVLIGICIIVAIISQAGGNHEALRYLFIAWYPEDFSEPVESFRTGQIWRLLTPIFIHFGLLHLIFNAMWLRDFGSFIETRFSAVYLGVLVLVIGVGSNIAQYLWTGSPWFGGMSGVNYGLFGFLWVRAKFDRDIMWRLNPTVVWTLMIWYFACFTGFLGPIANTAHTAGLLIGAAWGFISSGRLRLSR
jgi:rhomboid protease GlpG